MHRALLAALVAAAGIAGCGDEPTLIDHTVVESGIEAGIAQQQHILTTVACPKGLEARKGREFSCTATLASGRQVPVTVTATDDKGAVRYEGFNGFREGRPPKG